MGCTAIWTRGWCMVRILVALRCTCMPPQAGSLSHACHSLVLQERPGCPTCSALRYARTWGRPAWRQLEQPHPWRCSPQAQQQVLRQRMALCLLCLITSSSWCPAWLHGPQAWLSSRCRSTAWALTHGASTAGAKESPDDGATFEGSVTNRIMHWQSSTPGGNTPYDWNTM